MKSRVFIAALALSGAFSANAQNVTVYGLVDTGIEYLNHVGPTNATLLRMPKVTGTLPSRFGFRGSEDLGDGAKVFFVLESGINPNTGALNYGNRLFGRQALVGLSNQYGAVSLGRQYTMTLYALIDSDILGPNIYATASFDAYLPNTRADNAVGYMGKFGAVSLGATYSLGRDAAGPAGPQATNCGGELANDPQACRQWTAMVKYDGLDYGITASYDNMHGGPNALFGFTSSDFRDVRSSVNGWAIFLKKWKIAGGVLHRSNTSAASFASNMYYIGSSYELLPGWVLSGQVGYLNVIDSPNDAALLAVRALYNFSRRTAGYITAGRTINRGASAIAVSPGVTTLAGADQTGLMIGLRHSF